MKTSKELLEYLRQKYPDEFLFKLVVVDWLRSTPAERKTLEAWWGFERESN